MYKRQESLLSEPASNSRVQPVKGKTYYIKNVDSQLFMDVSRNSKSNGGNIHQWSFHGGDNQKFRIENFSGNARIISVSSGKSLDIENRSTSNGGNLQQWNSSSNAQNQKFTILGVPGNNRRFFIENLNSNKLLGIAGSSKSRGANIEQNVRNDASTRQWAFYLAN